MSDQSRIEPEVWERFLELVLADFDHAQGGAGGVVGTEGTGVGSGAPAPVPSMERWRQRVEEFQTRDAQRRRTRALETAGRPYGLRQRHAARLRGGRDEPA